MARASQSDPDLDRLYQVPPGEFVGQRNALAKRSGARSAEIRALQKPSLPAWAINQLYWRERDVYDTLIGRAEDLRATHGAAARGKAADLRGASRAHEEAVDAALKRTLALLAADGQPVTDATKQAIATTLRGLPADEAPGRLTRQLQPRGFEMLTGAAPAGQVRVAPAPPPKSQRTGKTGATNKRDAAAQAAAREKLAAAKEALAAATRATRDAEQAARREEFEAARAARNADKAQDKVSEAEQAVRQAEEEHAEAERAAAAAAKARDAAQARATRAGEALDDARAREEKARAALEKLN